MRQFARIALVAAALVAVTATPAAASGIVELRDCSAPYGVADIWVRGEQFLNVCWY